MNFVLLIYKNRDCGYKYELKRYNGIEAMEISEDIIKTDSKERIKMYISIMNLKIKSYFITFYHKKYDFAVVEFETL